MPDNDKLLRELNDRLATLEARVDYLDGVRVPAPRRARPLPWVSPQEVSSGLNCQQPNPDDALPRAATPAGEWFDPATGLRRNANGEVVNARAAALLDELTR